MSRKAGFTLIELLITAAITVIILIVAIPRYNSLLDQQRFSSDAENIVHCLQVAQQAAATPGTDVNSVQTGYVQVQIFNSTADTGVTCEVDRFKPQGTQGQTLKLTSSLYNYSTGEEINGFDRVESFGSFYYSTFEPNVKLLDAMQTVTNTESFNPLDLAAVKIIFGVRERGVPLILCRTNCVAAEGLHQNPYPADYTTSLGQGFSSAILLEDPTTSSDPHPTRGTITIGTLGTPISFKLN